MHYKDKKNFLKQLMSCKIAQTTIKIIIDISLMHLESAPKKKLQSRNPGFRISELLIFTSILQDLFESYSELEKKAYLPDHSGPENLKKSRPKKLCEIK